MATWTGIVDLETLTPDFTTDGIIITQVNSAQAGDGVTNTTLRLGDPLVGKNRVLRMNNTIRTTVNPNGTPCLDFADTLIVKTAGTTCFDKVVGGTTPLIRFRRVAMSYTTGGTWLFMTSDNRVQSIFEDVTITFDNYGFAFFGREAIWNNVVIRGNGFGDTFPPNLPLEINGLKLIDHSLMKLEHGSGGIYSVQMTNPTGGLGGFFYSGMNSSIAADQTDRCMWLLDAPIDAAKCSISNNGAIGTLRTIRASYKTPAGQGIANARMYTAYKSGTNWVDYRLTRARNTLVNAGASYQAVATADQDPTVPSAQTLRWMYILKPGDRVRLSGFTNAANNRDTTVVGQLNSTTGKFYATADRLVVSDAATLVAETSKAATITRLEPVSSATGAFNDTFVETGFARSLNSQGNNTYNSTLVLSAYQAGTQTGVAGQTLLREQWETYIVPPYPYKRETQEFAIPQSAPSLSSKVEWYPLALQDPLITQTNSATVLAYTQLDTPQKAYDYKEAWKRIDPNTLVGGVREGFFTRVNNTLDFGSLNVIIDPNAAAPIVFTTENNTVIQNGTFNTDTIWTKGDGVTISGGVLNAVAAANIAGQNAALISGRPYLVTLGYTSSANGGRFRFSNGNSGDTGPYIFISQQLVASGTVSFVFTATQAGFNIAADGPRFTGTIDNVTITDVLSRVTAVTLKASTYVGNITTTGMVSLLNNGIINGTYTDASGTRVSIRTSDNLPLSTYLTINGVAQPWQVGQTVRNILVGPQSTVRIYAHAYGYQPKIINITGNNSADYIITLIPDTNVDTTQNTTTRDLIASMFAMGTDGSRVFISISGSMSSYTTAQVLNALHYFIVNQGSALALQYVAQNSVSIFSLVGGGIFIGSNVFYLKAADTITTVSNTGVIIPLIIQVDASVYTTMPTYTPTIKNPSSVLLQYAPWTQVELDLPSWVATEDTALKAANNSLIAAMLGA